MSCDRRCYDPNDPHHGHENCSTCPGRDDGRKGQTVTPDPVFLILHCTACSTQHVDRGEWAERPHRTHLCEVCGHQWRPFEYTTIGVDAL